MEVGAGGHAGAAYGGDGVALGDGVAGGDRDALAVGVEGFAAVFMGEKDIVAQAGGEAGVGYRAAEDGADGDAPVRGEVKAAVEEGIVAGGGTVYVNAIPAVEQLVEELEGDEKTGARIIAKALEAPIRQIAANAGLDGSVVLENVKKAAKGTGFDAYKEEYVDMIAAGIVDPAKVTRSALENAASVAAMVLTTESLVADKPEPPAPPAPGGMGGMDGMY